MDGTRHHARGGAAHRRDSSRQWRRRRPCWFAAAAILLASVQMAHSQPAPTAYPGQSFNLTALAYGSRAVTLGWIHEDNTVYGDGVFHLAKYVIYSGGQVILDDPNVTSVTTTVPCGSSTCLALQLSAEVSNLALGQHYEFTVGSVYYNSTNVGGGDPVAGQSSSSVRMLVTDPPSAPLALSAQAIVGGMKLSWQPPASTGIGGIWSVFYSNASEVLRGYKLLVSTSPNPSPKLACAGGQSDSCYSSVLPSWAAEALVTGLQGGVAYNVWLLAYNVLFEGDVTSLPMSFTVRGLATEPLHAILSLEDHLVLQLQWQPPNATGAEIGRPLDYYSVEWTRATTFSSCRADGNLQCYTTKDIALPGGCRQCAVQTCQADEVCFSSEVQSEDGMRYMVLGCTSAQSQAGASIGDGPCGSPFTNNAYYNCHFCNTARCNNAVPSTASSHFCPQSGLQPYCAQEVGAGSVVISAAGPGEEFSTRVVGEQACSASTQVYFHNVPPNVSSLSVGSTAFSSGDVPFSLDDGSTYYFRVAACWQDLGCGAFSTPLMRAATRLPVSAQVEPVSKTAGVRTDVNVRLTLIKGVQQWGMLLLRFPVGYKLDEQVAMDDLESLCSNATHIQIAANGGNASNASNAIFETMSPMLNASCPNDCIGRGICFNNATCVEPNSSTVSQMTCTMNGVVVSTFTTVVRGNEVTVKLPGNFHAAPGQYLTFRLRGITNHQVSGSSPRVRISTLTVLGDLIDDNSHVPGYILTPGGLAVSVDFATPIAGQFSNLSVSVTSPGGYPAGSLVVLNTQGNFSFNDAILVPSASGLDASLLQVLMAGKDMLAIRVNEAITQEALQVALSRVLVGAVVGDTGVFQAHTELQNVKMGTNASVAGVTIRTGVLKLELTEEWESLTFGSTLDLAMQYTHSRSLSMMPGLAVLIVQFPSGMNLSGTVAEIKGGAGGGIEQAYDYVTYNITGNVTRGYEMEVFFGENRTDVGMGEPLFWTIRLLGVGLPHFTLDAASISAQTASRTLDLNNAVLTNTVANTTTLPLTYVPGIMKQVEVQLSSTDAGALADVSVNFTSSNPMPQQAILEVSSSEFVKLCDGCQVFLNTSSGAGVGNLSFTLKSQTKLLIALDNDQVIPAGSPFRLRVEGVRILPWAGSFTLQLSLVDVVSTQTVERALNITPVVVGSSVLASVECELAEPSPDRLGKWNTSRPVKAGLGFVHMGIRLVPPADIPSDSYMLVRVAGARIMQVQLDPVYPHIQGIANYVATVTDDGGLMLTQSSPTVSLESLRASVQVAFNLMVSVSVTSGSLRGVEREYGIQVFQTRSQPSMIASFTGQFRDTLIPASPSSFLSPGMSQTTVSLSTDLAGDVADVTLKFRLMTDVSPMGSFIVNLPADASLELDSSVTKVGMDGSLLVNLSRSSNSLVLSRDPSDSTALVYGETETTCRTVGGTAQLGSACVFPFVYFGATFDSCTTQDNGNVPWCSTTQRFNGLWGNCNCTENEIPLDISITVRRVRLPTFSGPLKFQVLAADSSDKASTVFKSLLQQQFTGQRHLLQQLNSSLSDECASTCSIHNGTMRYDSCIQVCVVAYDIQNASDYLVAQDVGIQSTLRSNRIGNVSVVLSPAQAGAEANLTLTVIVFNPLPVDGILQVEFSGSYTECWNMEHFSLNSPTQGITSSGEVLEVRYAWPIMNLTRSGGMGLSEAGPGSSFVITVVGLSVRPWSGDVAFEVRTRMGPYLGYVVADSTQETFRIYPNELLDVGVDLTSSVAGSKAAAAVRFRPNNAVPVHGGILVTLPVGFELDDPSLQSSWKLCGMVGAANITLENIHIDQEAGSGRWQVLMMFSETQMLSNNALVEFTIPGVVIRRYSGLSGPFTIRTVSCEGAFIDSFNGAPMKIVPDMLSAASVAVLSAQAGAVSSVQVSFTVSNPLPANGQISVAFPNNLELEFPVSNGYLNGIVGMLAVSSYVPEVDGRCPVGAASHLGCNVTLQVEGDETAGGRSISFGLTNVRMMHVAGDTGTYILQTRTMEGAIIDEVTVGHSSVGPSKLGFASVSSQSVMRVNGNATLKVSFTTANPVSTGDFVYVMFSPLFNLSDTCYSYGGCGQVAVSGSGVALYATEHDRAIISVTQNYPAESDVQFVISGVKAPALGGFTGTYQVKTVSASGVDIDIDLDVEQLSTAPAEMHAELNFNSVAAGDETNIVVMLNVTTAIPAQDAFLVLVLPDGASFASGASAQVLSGLDGGLELSVSGNAVMLKRRYASQQAASGTTIVFSLSGVINPPRAGSFTYIIRSKKSVPSRTVSGLSSDTGSLMRVLDEVSLSVTIDPAPLEYTGVYPFPLSVGYRGPIRVRFRVANPLPADGIIQLEFSNGLADLSSVLTSTFMSASRQEAQATFVDGTTHTETLGSAVVVSRTSGAAVEAGVIGDVEVSIVQLHGFVNMMGHIQVSTISADGVVIDSESVPVHIVDPGVLTEGEAQFSDCATLVTCSGPCGGCSGSRHTISGTISFGPGEYVADSTCEWIIAAECGDLVFSFTSFQMEQTFETVEVYECSTKNCSVLSPPEILTGTLSTMPVYRPASGFMKVVFTSDSYSAPQFQGFEAVWSSKYSDHRAIGSPATAAGTEARLHLSFWSANEVPVDGMMSIQLPSGGHADEQYASCFVNSSGNVSDAPVKVTKGTAFAKGDTINMTVAHAIPQGQVVDLTCSNVHARTWAGLSEFQVRTTTRDGDVIDAGVATALVSAGALEDLMLNQSERMAGYRNDLEFTFRTRNMLPPNAVVEVEVPIDFTVAMAQLASFGSVGGEQQSFRTTFEGRSIMINLKDVQVAPGTLFHMTLHGMMNRNYAGAVTIFVRTRHPPRKYFDPRLDRDFSVIDEDARTLTIDPVSNSAVSVMPSESVAGIWLSLTFTYTLQSPLPADGAVSIMFPPHYDVSKVSTSSSFLYGVDGVANVEVRGRNVTLSRFEGTEVGAQTQISVQVVNVQLPPFEDLRGKQGGICQTEQEVCFFWEIMTLGIRDPTTSAIETAFIPPVATNQSALSIPGSPYSGFYRRSLPSGPGTVRVSPAKSRAGDVTDLTVDFWTVNMVPTGGHIVLELASGFTVDVYSTPQCTSSDVQVSSLSITNNGTTLQMTLGAPMKESLSVVFTCMGIKVQEASGLHVQHHVYTSTPDMPPKTIDAGYGYTDVVSGTVMPAYVQLSTLQAGSPVTLLVSASLTNRVPVSGMVEMDLPAAFSPIVSTSDFTVTANFLNLANPIIFDYGGASGCRGLVRAEKRGDAYDLSSHPQGLYSLRIQSVDCTLSADSVLTFNVSGLRNRGWEGPTGTLWLRTRNPDGALIDGCNPDDDHSVHCQSEPVAESELVPSSPTPAEVRLEVYTAGNEGRLRISFTTSTTFYNDSIIEVTLPDGFALNRYAPLSGLHRGIDGLLDFRVQGVTRVTLSRREGTDLMPGSNVRLELSGVQNRKISDCSDVGTCRNSSGDLQLRLATRDGVTTDQVTIMVEKLDVAFLEEADVEPSALVAGSLGHVVVAFRLVNPLPADGKIYLDFPAGVSLVKPLIVQSISGIDGLFAVSTSGERRVIIDRLRGSLVHTGDEVRFNLTGVRNRVYSGLTGTYQIRTALHDGTLIDADLDVASDMLQPGEIQNVHLRPDSLVAGVTSKLVVSFAVANPLPPNGGIELLLPEGFKFPEFARVADGVLDLPTAGRAMRVNHIAYPFSASEGRFRLEFLDERTVKLWRNETNQSTLPCNYSKPEFELRRDVISPGCSGSDEFYKDCTISFAFENITNRHSSGELNLYRLRTLLPDGTMVDEALVNGHEVTNGVLLGTRVHPASLVAGQRTTALVTMLASNGLPSDGKVELVFPEGFDVRGLTLGTSASNLLIADGGALIADQVPEFVNLRATTNSRIREDKSRISFSFEMNVEPEPQTSIIIGNLDSSITASTPGLECGGQDRDKFAPLVAWSRSDGQITFKVIANIPAGHVVNVWCDLQNPNGTTTMGVHPTIKSVPPTCGFQCASQPTAIAEFGGDEVLHVNDTARSLIKNIASVNRVAGELNTIVVTLQFNFALWPGHRAEIRGLVGTQTISNANLSVVGQGSAYFEHGGIWRQTEGSLTLEVWDTVPAYTRLVLRFTLKTKADPQQTGVTPTLLVEGDHVTFVEVAQEDMIATDVLLATESPKFFVKSIGQNTVAFNAWNKVTVTLRPTAVLPSGTRITITGLTGSPTGGSTLMVHGKDASVVNPIASWNRDSGTLTLTVATQQSGSPGMLDDQDTVLYVMLRNPAGVYGGSVASIHTNYPNFAASTVLDGGTLRAQAQGNFSKATLSYSSNRAFVRNQVYLSLTPNANLPAGSTITVTKLPLDTETNAMCLATTVHDTPCMFPFVWAGQTWTTCVTQAAVSGGVSTPLNQGLPWCPTQSGFLQTLANQTQHNVSYINDQLGSSWSYCKCDTVSSKIIVGKDADLFDETARWDFSKSTLTLTLAPGKEISAGQEVDISFQIRNPGVQIQSGIPEYMWARVAAKVVDPYIEAKCSTVNLFPNRTLDWGLSRYISEVSGEGMSGILVLNITELPNPGNPAQQKLLVHYCYFEVDSFGNIYGLSPMIEVKDDGIFSTARQQVNAEALVIQPHGCSLSSIEGDANVSSIIKINSDPTWVVSSMGIGSSNYGALTSITVTLQPNWELEHPTEISVCCIQGLKVPNPEDGTQIAVFNEAGQVFGYKGTFEQESGVVKLVVAESMTVPCNKTSIVSFKLRNFANWGSFDIPTNLTATGPLGFFSSMLTTPAAAVIAKPPSGFYWAYKQAADSSAAYGTLNLITVTIQPSQELFYPTRITIGNLLGSTTPTNREPGFSQNQPHPLTLMGQGALHFSKAEWINDLDSCGSLNQLDCVDADARLILHIEDWVSSSAPTIVSFYLRNKPFFVAGRVPTISVAGFSCNHTGQSVPSGWPNASEFCSNNATCAAACNQLCGEHFSSPLSGFSDCLNRCHASAGQIARSECEISDAFQSMQSEPLLEASSPAGFTMFAVSPSTRVVGALSTITVSLQPNWYIAVGTMLTLTGMTDTCPDSAAYYEPPAYCQNVQNPSSSMTLQGASQATFGGTGSWNSLTGHLVLSVYQAIAAGTEIEIKFNLRNKGIMFKGVELGLKIPVLGSELMDGMLIERDMRRVTVQRTGQGRTIQPGETLTFTLQHIRVPEHAGPTGVYQLRTMLGDGTLLDQDLAVGPSVILRSQLQARLSMTPKIAGARGDVLVEMSTSNPVPSGGTIHVWFPAGFQLDTGHWDVIVNDDYIKGGRDGLQVVSGSGNFTVQVGTEGTKFQETGLGAVFTHHTSAIVTNVGPVLPAWERWNFTLKGVQFPMASVVRAVGAGGGNGTYQVRTFTQERAIIDEDADVPGGAFFEPGRLLHAEVLPGSLVAGAVSDLTISFVTFNPMSADSRIELTLPEGFAFAGDPNHQSLEGYEAVGPWRADHGLDYTLAKDPGVFLPVGSTRARNLQVEVLDDSLEGNLTLTVHDTRRCTFWRRAETSLQRHSRVRFRVFDPTTDFPVLENIIGVRNPTVSGQTGTFQLRVRLYDTTLIDQDLEVPALFIEPGALSNVHVGPLNSTTGALSDLRVSFVVGNPLPVNSSIRVTLPFEDISVAGTPVLSQGQDALDGAVDVSVETSADGVETLLLKRVNSATTVSPCVKPMCNSENMVKMEVAPTAFQSSWRRPPSYAAYAFASDGTSWISGPSLPHWVQYDFGEAMSVCSYAFQSRPKDVLGYLRADGPTSYQLLGSLDGTSFTVLHEVTDGDAWTTGDEERAHALHTNALFRYFRLQVTGVPGRFTGNKYTVLRNLRLMAPTGADPHSAVQERQQCLVTVVIPNLVRNRHFAGVTNPYKVVTYDSSGSVIDQELRGQGSQVEPAMLLDGSVVPTSTLAGEVVTMRVSFTPINEIPPNGHVEVVFPTGIDLSMLPTTPQVGIFNGTEIFENFNGNPGGIVVRVTGQAVQIVRDNSGDPILANVPFSLLLTKIRNQPFPGLGGNYVIRTKAHESILDRNETVAGTLFTTQNFKNLTLTLSTDVAGGIGPVRLEFVPMNPIPADGRIHLKLPDEYVLLHPLHADWLEGADGFIATTVEPDGSILMSRDGEHEAPRYVKMVVELSTIINVPRSGNALNFSMCTQLHDRRRIDCVAPTCTGCQAEVTPVMPQVMQPATLVNASVVPEAAVTGHEGLLVQFTTVNALRADSVLQIAIPAGLRFGAMHLEGLSFQHAPCYESNNPPNNTASPVALPPFALANTNMNVSVNSSMDYHLVSITLPGLVRATRVLMNVRGVRNPLIRAPTGTFQLMIRNPDGFLVDSDLNLSSVGVVQGQLVAASVSADRDVAGDMIELTVRFTSINNYIPAWGYVDITLPPSFYACPCQLNDTSLIAGAEPVSCAQVGCLPGNEIRPDFIEVMSDGTERLNQGNLTYTAVDSNGTFIRLRPQAIMSGEIELKLRNIRSQNFSGPTGTFQIQTRTENGDLMDEHLAVPGYTLLTAGPGYITNTKVTVMDPTAGGRGRVLVEFVPYNPLPPESMIAIVLPVGFEVSPNSSVAQPLGNSPLPSEQHFYIEEWDDDVSLDGELEVQVHGDVLVTVSRKGSAVATPPHTRVAFFLDMVRNPQRSGTTGTFQVRTLLSSGVPIDEDLQVSGVSITPGNFTGDCPPFCAPPEVKPSSLLAGSKVNISVAFYASNPLPVDGQIEVQLHENARVIDQLLVSAGSVLDVTRENVEQVGPVLDGKLITFLHGHTVRVRRDGTGRRIEVGEMVSLTIQGIQNQDAEGNTGVAHLWTKQSDGIVIDESVIVGHVLVPVEFIDFILAKDELTAGKMSTLSISLATSGPIKPGSKLTVDFSNEMAVSPLDANSLVLDAASSSWALSIEDDVRLVLLYQGAEPIPGGDPTDISVSNVPNPAVAFQVVYLMSLLAPGSLDPTNVYRSFQYEVGGLSHVTMTPVSLKAGHTGIMTVSFQILNPLQADSIIEIELPSTFAFTDSITSLTTADSWMDGILDVMRISDTRVSIYRAMGSVVPAGGIVELILYNVRNQEFSGVTPLMTVTTRTFDGELIDTGLSDPIIMSVAALGAVAVTLDTAVAGTVEKATVNFRTGSPIPHDGQLLVQFPPGMQVLNPPEYMSFMGHPVKVKVYPGTPASLDTRIYSAQEATPYFTFNATHAYPPSAVAPGMLRGPSVLLSRVGGESIAANSNVHLLMPGVKVRPWSGFSGTFQVMTMLKSFELIDEDPDVNGLTVHPATFTDVAIKVSSLVSGVAVTVSVNLTLSNALPPTSEIHVTFPAGYRTIQYAKVETHLGLLGDVEPIGVVPVVGGGTVLKLRHTHTAITPEGTKIFLVLTDIVNRFFSSRSQYFQLGSYRADGVTHIERSEGIVVPVASDSISAPGFGVVVESDLVMIFDSHDPTQAVNIVSLDEGTGTVTHGVSALDRAGDVVYFIAGGKLLSLELFSPTLVAVPLKTGADQMLGFVSMEWDATHERLVGLALVDGEMAMCTVDTVSGNVSRIADLAACGTCECTPSQGVSALDVERGVYYLASQVTVLALNSSTGSLVSQTSVVQGDEGFLGFASLEFDGQGHQPRYIAMGLMGVAQRGDKVELVQINPETGDMKTLAKIFDEVFTGQIVGGISALTPGNTHYMLLAQSRLLAVDLETRVVSYYSPYEVGASGAWAFLEMSQFFTPSEEYVQAQTGGDSTNVVQRPVDVAELNITVVGLEESLPVKRGSVASGNFFSVRLSGSDVNAGDHIQVSPSGDCSTVLPGGGPFSVLSNGMHTQRFYLELDDKEPKYAQFCYRRTDAFDATFRALPYGGTAGKSLLAVNSLLIDFATTMASFSFNQSPLPVGTRVSMTLSGALGAGDTVRMVMNDGSIHVADLCNRAPLYPGTQPVSVVSIDPQQIRSYAFGAVTEILTDLMLEASGAAELAVCYRPAGSSSFALLSGRQRAGASDPWHYRTTVAVAEGDSSSDPVCAAAASINSASTSTPYSSAML